MIPKIIHYCRFGNQPLNDTARSCIDSWHRQMPDFEIKEWNENNFDVNKYAFTREAVKSGLFELVADVCRFEALRAEGGIFIDTSVEAVASFDNHLSDDRGFLTYDNWQNNMIVIASVPGAPWTDALLEFYRRAHLIDSFGRVARRSEVRSAVNKIWATVKVESRPVPLAQGRFCTDSRAYNSGSGHKDVACVHHMADTWSNRVRPNVAKRVAERVMGLKHRWLG